MSQDNWVSSGCGDVDHDSQEAFALDAASFQSGKDECID